MSRERNRWFVLLSLVSALLLVSVMPSRARAQNPALEEAKRSAAELNRWLGSNPNGDRWRTFLKLDQLNAELAKGEGADPSAVAATLTQFAGQQPGLELSRFQAVKKALANLSLALPRPQPANLVASVREAEQAFTPVTPEDVAKTKAALTTAVQKLDQYLARSGTANTAAWKKYLDWDKLTAILAQSEPPPADLVQHLKQQYMADVNGVELPEFVRTRQALANYADTAAAAANPMLQQEYSANLAKLATHLEAYEQNPTSGDDALAIADALEWLARSRQAPGVRANVSQLYNRHNYFGSVSARLAAVGMEDAVDETTPVIDNILGTAINGTARLTGRTSLAVLDSPNTAAVNILLNGTAVSRNVGYNGPVTLQSSGITSVAGSKRLSMTAAGIAAEPSVANCRTSSTIHSINARRGFIENAAWKRAAQSKGQAEAIASQKASVRVSRRMDEKAAPMIAEQQQRYQDKFKNPLVRRGQFPQDMHFSSRPDRISLRMLQAVTGQIAAPNAPPDHGVPHDLGIRAHESMVVNFGQATIAGEELTDLRLEKLIKEDLEGDLPEELRVTLPDGTLDPDKEPWSIIFARELPVRAKFQDGGLWLAIRADGFTRGESETPGKYKPVLKELVEIAAQYKIERTPVGATLKRDGDVQIRFPNRENPEQVTIRDSATVTFMRRKFRNLFKEEFVGEGLKLKGRWEKAGTLALSELSSDKSWLTLAWNMPATAARPVAPPASPTTGTAAAVRPVAR